MQIHLLIALPAGIVLHEATSSALDLHATPCLLLDVLYVTSTRTHNLRTQVEARDGLEVDWDALFRPLTTAERVTLNLFWLSATEATLVDQVGQFLLHELVDLLDGFLEAVFGGAGNMEVERWVL